MNKKQNCLVKTVGCALKDYLNCKKLNYKHESIHEYVLLLLLLLLCTYKYNFALRISIKSTIRHYLLLVKHYQTFYAKGKLTQALQTSE